MKERTKIIAGCIVAFSCFILAVLYVFSLPDAEWAKNAWSHYVAWRDEPATKGDVTASIVVLCIHLSARGFVR